MKVVINACFGGFGLSPRAVKRLAELNGRECYFYKNEGFDGLYQPITLEEAEAEFMWSAFDVPNVNEVIGKSFRDADGLYGTYNALYSAHALDKRDVLRNDPKLIQVVEELGGEHRKGASGACAKLRIVEIPDGVEWEISEYDGSESIHEVHRSWR